MTYVSLINILLYLAGSDGALTRTPKSATLIPGTVLRLNCSTNRTGVRVHWTFKAEGSTIYDDMTVLGALVPAYRLYFYMDTSSPYDLVAHTANANESYCGMYKCTEDVGAGDISTATVASMWCMTFLSYYLYSVSRKKDQNVVCNLFYKT